MTKFEQEATAAQVRFDFVQPTFTFAFCLFFFFLKSTFTLHNNFGTGVTDCSSQAALDFDQADDPFGAAPFDAEKIKRHLAKQNSLKSNSKVESAQSNQTNTLNFIGKGLDIPSSSSLHSGQLSFPAISERQHFELFDPLSKSSSSFETNSAVKSIQSKSNQDLIWFQ